MDFHFRRERVLMMEQCRRCMCCDNDWAKDHRFQRDSIQPVFYECVGNFFPVEICSDGVSKLPRVKVGENNERLYGMSHVIQYG